MLMIYLIGSLCCALQCFTILMGRAGLDGMEIEWRDVRLSAILAALSWLGVLYIIFMLLFAVVEKLRGRL